MTKELIDNILIVKDTLIGLAAFVGMGLGIYNLFRERSKGKVKLKVIPKAVTGEGTSSSGQRAVRTSESDFPTDYIHELFAIEVINLSEFPVVIDEVGLFLKGTDRRLSLPIPIVGDKKIEWPKKLERRESIVLYSSMKNLLSLPDLQRAKCAFARTSCNSFGKGTSGALNGLIKFSRK